jgi:hypothetical protein
MRNRVSYQIKEISTTVDLLGSEIAVFRYFRVQHTGNIDDKEWEIVKWKYRSHEA